MATRTYARERTAKGSPVQAAAVVVGIAFVLVGALGFAPLITTDRDAMELAGHESHAHLFGIFQVSVLHNVLHLALGAAGLAFARTPVAARAYLLAGGAAYLVLSAYGAVVDRGAQANVVPLNAADDWLHLVLGLGMIALGVVLGRRSAARSPR
jgi:hypothetical protein